MTEGEGTDQNISEVKKEDTLPQIYYGVCIPEDLLQATAEPVTSVFTDKVQALKMLKEFKGSRFKVFSSETEAYEFSTSTQPFQQTQVSTPVPKEGSTFGGLKPQQLVKFRKSIESGNIDFILECVRENPRYLMTPSDTPAILQEGSRYNALHVSSKSGKSEVMKILLDIIKGDLAASMYPEADSEQNSVRQQRLVDLYLNMPDKGGGDTPLHLASKFGHLEIVEILTAEEYLDTRVVNKFGETALDVVGTRAKIKNTKSEQRIKELVEGLWYIPICRNVDGIAIKGDPIPKKDIQAKLYPSVSSSGKDVTDSCVTPLKRPGSGDGSSERMSSPGPIMLNDLNMSSPGLTPKRGALNRTFSLSSPAQVSNGALITSPLSPANVTRSPADDRIRISALIGPMSEKGLEDFYKEMRSTNSRERVQQRRQNPSKGIERQWDNAARKISVNFTEYWPFLDQYLDLSSQEGLERLEHHLENLQEQLILQEQEDRCREVEPDEDDPNNSVFGEMEFICKKPPHTHKRGFDSQDVVNNNHDVNTDIVNTPQSPVSMLSSAFQELGFSTSSHATTEQSIVNHQHNDQHKARRPSVEAKEMVHQFGFMFAQALTDHPSSDLDSNIQDWGLTLLNHWENLRRQVNIMRSDPQGRWSAVNFASLASRILERVEKEVDESVTSQQYSRIQANLQRIVDYKLTSTSDEMKSAGSIAEFRIQRQESGRDVSKLKEIQPFVRNLVYFMQNRNFCENENLEKLWNLNYPVNVSTQKVNKARKFLHSKVFSDSSSSADTSDCLEDFSWINGSEDSAKSLLHNDNQWSTYRRRRADSESSQTSQASSQYCTPPGTPPSSPPSSPAASVASSMLTADTGLVVWMEGKDPTQTDRQVFAALQTVNKSDIQNYPNLWSYYNFILAGNYDMEEMRKWPNKIKNESKSGMEPRKLDLDMSSLNL